MYSPALANFWNRKKAANVNAVMCLRQPVVPSNVGNVDNKTHRHLVPSWPVERDHWVVSSVLSDPLGLELEEFERDWKKKMENAEKKPVRQIYG